jgi:hypothetical protein
MNSDDQPYPIRVFLDKLKFFTVFNVIFALWILTEVIFYSVVTS